MIDLNFFCWVISILLRITNPIALAYAGEEFAPLRQLSLLLSRKKGRKRRGRKIYFTLLLLLMLWKGKVIYLPPTTTNPIFSAQTPGLNLTLFRKKNVPPKIVCLFNTNSQQNICSQHRIVFFFWPNGKQTCMLYALRCVPKKTQLHYFFNWVFSFFRFFIFRELATREKSLTPPPPKK